MKIELLKHVRMLKHVRLLGYQVKDRITGAAGVVESISFDLYGCIQATVNTGLKEDGDRKPTYWFDISRLEVTSEEPVMAAPNFVSGDTAEGLKGPADKPEPFA